MTDFVEQDRFSGRLVDGINIYVFKFAKIQALNSLFRTLSIASTLLDTPSPIRIATE